MNFNDVIEPTSNFLLPEGDYEAKCIECFQTTGYDQNTPCNIAGLKLSVNFWGRTTIIIQKTPLNISWRPKIKEIHSAAGFDVSRAFKMNWDSMKGKTFRVNVVIKEYNGQKRNYVDKFYPPIKRFEPKSMTAEEWHTTPHYKNLRAECMKKYKNKCAICDMPAEHMHHKKRPGYGRECIDDVVMLCSVCHKAIEHK